MAASALSPTSPCCWAEYKAHEFPNQLLAMQMTVASDAGPPDPVSEHSLHSTPTCSGNSRLVDKPPRFVDDRGRGYRSKQIQHAVRRTPPDHAAEVQTDDERGHRNHLEAQIGRMLAARNSLMSTRSPCSWTSVRAAASPGPKTESGEGSRVPAAQSSGHASGGTVWRRRTPAKERQGRLPRSARPPLPAQPAGRGRRGWRPPPQGRRQATPTGRGRRVVGGVVGSARLRRRLFV